MRRLSLFATILSATVILSLTVGAQNQSEKKLDVLEGVLAIHPKFHYRYYINQFGGGQSCALSS